MTTINDPEFGEIIIRRQSQSVNVRIKLDTSGRLVATAPRYTPIFYIRTVINTSRANLRKITQHHSLPSAYEDGQLVGKSHHIAVVLTGMVKKPIVKIERQKIIVMLPPKSDIASPDLQQAIRDAVRRALRIEAKAYLPKRLSYLASQHGFSYERTRFSHAGSRWGSCSSSGTISLNIALMKLPHELIDYVLIHELCHTREMNHSRNFWQHVATYDSLYKLHRQQLKKETPTV